MAASPNDTVIVAGDGRSITDNSGNVWTIENGQVWLNNAPDLTTANVIEMALVDGDIWQENNSDLWYMKTKPSDTWSPGAGQAASPLPATTLTWIGGGDNLATDPKDWSPTGVPQGGDTLIMPGGIMNIVGNALQGDALSLLGNQAASTPPTYTLNLSGSLNEGIEDNDGANYGLATVNLAAGAQWTGGIDAGPYGQGAVIRGVGTWDNTNTSVNNTVVVDVPVAGTGTFTALGAHSQAPLLEFMQAVPASQSVLVEGGSYGNEHGNLQIDDLTGFQAPVTLGFGEIILNGVTANSYTYQNDVLSLFNGDLLVGTLNLAMQTQPYGQAPTDFGVSQAGGNVVIHADGTAYNGGGTLLPVHVIPPPPPPPPPVQASTIEVLTNSPNNVFDAAHGTASGDTFLLDGGESRMTVGLSSTVWAFGYDDTITAQGASNSTIYDRGTLMHVIIGADTSVSIDANAAGMSHDWGWTLSETGVSAATLQASAHPDGHGGIMVGVNGSAADLMYAAYIRSGEITSA